VANAQEIFVEICVSWFDCSAFLNQQLCLFDPCAAQASTAKVLRYYIQSLEWDPSSYSTAAAAAAAAARNCKSLP
jgi:hypothetical protein